MPTQPYFIISILCALQGVLLSLIFLFRKNNHLAGKIFGAYICIFSLGMLENFLKQNLTGTAGQLVYSFLGFSNFLYGPLLYLFVYFLPEKAPVFKSRLWLHFLPFGFLYGLDTVLILSSGQGIRHELIELALFEMLIIQILGYNMLAFLKLKKYGSSILQINASLEPHDIKWLQLVVSLLTGIYILSFAITHAVIFGVKEASEYYILVQVSITGLIYFMSYRLLLQPKLFLFSERAEIITIQQPGTPSDELPEKYQRSGLKPEQGALYLQTLLAFMETEKPYRDPDFTIYNLSERLSISRNHLTEIINEKLEKNFFEFVNSYRVEEVKDLINDPAFSHLNLYALGLEAGFRSKSAFNTNFKKLTGLTPSEWKLRTQPDTPARELALKEVLT